jgi:hypothetical protein
MKVSVALFDTRATVRASLSRRVEKSSASSTLADDHAAMSGGFFERRRSGRPSRFETRLAYDPEQRGPSPLFAAQVLGQILNAGRNNPAAAARTYARATSRQKEKRLVGIL